MRWTKVMGAVMAAQLSVAGAAELNDGLVLLPPRLAFFNKKKRI